LIDSNFKPVRIELTPEKIFEELDRFVIGQQKAKRIIALAAYNHLKRIFFGRSPHADLIKKSNVLMIGPTGCGKTHIARNLAKILDLPFTIVDITEYTEAGYYGKDVEVMIGELLYRSDFDIKATENGIVFIDEIDKIARRSSGMRTGAGARDIGGEGVQQALLKLLEGRKLFVPLNITQHWNKHDFVEIDTTNILFICAGTFSDLRGVSSPSAIGFETETTSGIRRDSITQKNLIEYGLIPELLGRIPVNVQLEELGSDDLVRVLKDPPDSLIKEYTQLLALDGVKLEFDDGALSEIAAYSLKKHLGARGLRSIMEEILHDIMFKAPGSIPGVVQVTPELVRDRLDNFDPGLCME